MIFYKKDIGGRMMAKESLCLLKYCPHCGSIEGHFRGRCAICDWDEVFVLDPKYNITDEAFDNIGGTAFVRGEITEKDLRKRWEEYCRPFLENVVMTGPYFSPDAYKLYIERHFTSEPKEVRQKYVDTMFEVYKKIQTVKCPFCGSTNTKKISHVLRMFGLSNKWWHCKNCKNAW